MIRAPRAGSRRAWTWPTKRMGQRCSAARHGRKSARGTVADPANPKFTPTGGVWDMVYRGVAQADGSDVFTMTGLMGWAEASTACGWKKR